jgi:hypothetical protein
MPKYHYTQTVTYTVTIEADSEEAADEIVNGLDVTADSVQAYRIGWEEDGYDD